MSDLYAEIMRKPLDGWIAEEKKIYKFWRALTRSPFEGQLAPNDPSNDLTSAVKELAKATGEVREECAKIKWAVRILAFFVVSFLTFGGFQLLNK